MREFIAVVGALGFGYIVRAALAKSHSEPTQGTPPMVECRSGVDTEVHCREIYDEGCPI